MDVQPVDAPTARQGNEATKLRRQVIELFAFVAEGLAGATDALLSGNREMARAVVATDALIDELYRDIENILRHHFYGSRADGEDLRQLLCLLQIVPELERSGDLVEHIAQRAARDLTRELTPRVRGIVAEMGQVGVDMWRRSANAYADRDPGAADGLDKSDDALDDLLVSLTAELASGSVSVPVAIELALVGRFYERLGDHAVNVARRISASTTRLE